MISTTRALVFFGLALSLAAQDPGPPQPAPGPGPGPGPGTGTAPGPGGPTRPTDPFPRQPGQPQIGDPRDRTQFPEMQRPIFLSGKVVLDDGTPPPEPVVIERVCNGTPRPEGYTDSKGRFSFQVGQNSHMMPDASISSSADRDFGNMGGTPGRQSQPGGLGGGRGVTERDLMGCELRAVLPGFRSEMVNLAGRRMMDNPDVGTIILRRLGNVEGLTISATTALAPKDARKAWEKGREAAKKQKWVDAQREFEKATQMYPKFAAAWYDLGRMHERSQAFEEALKAYAQSLDADAKFVNPYMQIAGLQARESKWQEVADTTARVIKLNPLDYPVAYFYNAVANLNLQKLDVAEKSAIEAKKIDTRKQIPKIDHVLGVILANRQDYAGAAQHMRSYLAAAPLAGDAELVKKQLADLEKNLAARNPQSPQ